MELRLPPPGSGGERVGTLVRRARPRNQSVSILLLPTVERRVRIANESRVIELLLENFECGTGRGELRHETQTPESKAAAPRKL